MNQTFPLTNQGRKPVALYCLTRRLPISAIVLLSLTILIISGCAKSSLQNRLGLVKDSKSGNLFGSTVEANIVTDSSLFKNRKIKIRIRNTSGDMAFNLNDFSHNLTSNIMAKGYEPVSLNSDDFGLLLDVNVMYSGHIETNLGTEFAFLGAAFGAVRGAQSSSDYGMITGPVAGAAIGSILGSYVTDDTYIIVSSFTFSEIRGGKKKTGKTITFSRSTDPNWDDEDRQEKEEYRTRRYLKNTVESGVAVYGGGTAVSQDEIAQQVRERIVRIMSDMI